MQRSLYKDNLDEWCWQSTRTNWIFQLEKSPKLGLVVRKGMPSRENVKKGGVEVRKDAKVILEGKLESVEYFGATELNT